MIALTSLASLLLPSESPSSELQRLRRETISLPEKKKNNLYQSLPERKKSHLEWLSNYSVLTPGDDVRRVHLTWFYTLQASQRLLALDEADEQCFKRSQHVQPGQPAPWTSCPGCPRWSCPPGEPPRPPRRRPRHASSSSAPLQSAALNTSTRCFWKWPSFEKLIKGRVAELGSLSSGAKMAMKIFVKCVFTIFAANASFLRVIANLQT